CWPRTKREDPGPVFRSIFVPKLAPSCRPAEDEPRERGERKAKASLVSSSLGGRRQGEGQSEGRGEPERKPALVFGASVQQQRRRLARSPLPGRPRRQRQPRIPFCSCQEKQKRDGGQRLRATAPTPRVSDPASGGRDASRKPPTSVVDARPRHHRSVHTRGAIEKEETGDDVHAEDAPTPRTRSPKPSRATLTLPYTRECQITATEGKETTGHVFASWYRDSPRPSQRDLLKETSVDSACEEGGTRWGQK
ncbi:unnamed protein product, partial [Ixodes persulcatus]